MNALVLQHFGTIQIPIHVTLVVVPHHAFVIGNCVNVTKLIKNVPNGATFADYAENLIWLNLFLLLKKTKKMEIKISVNANPHNSV